jgi:hypothetical protein
MSKRVRVAVFGVALALVMAVIGLLASRSGSRGALQRYQAALVAKGEKLTYAELVPPRLTNTVDSYALITNATPKLRNGRFVPGLLAPRSYTGPGQAIPAWQQPSPDQGGSALPGRAGAWEEFDSQMQSAEGALQDIRAALKDPAADAGPCTNMLTSRRLNFVSIRSAAQWLMGAAENDLHQGRLEAALQNVEALAALARMERDEPSLVAQMIRVAVAGLGLAVTWDALQAPGWTEPQLARLQKAWEQADLVEAVEWGFLSARAGGYELFTQLRHSRGAQVGTLFGRFIGGNPFAAPPSLEEVAINYLYFPAYKLTSIDEDELFYLRRMQESLGALRLLRGHRPWPEVRRELTNVTVNVVKVSNPARRLRYLLSAMTIPNCEKAAATAVDKEIERQMTLAAIALKRFEMRHGRLPPNLEALVPEILAAVPYDYGSAKPLRYRLKEDGEYVLYSVGVDGKDDGGDPTPRAGATPGLWEGRDAVWPSAAVAPGEPSPQARR